MSECAKRQTHVLCSVCRNNDVLDAECGEVQELNAILPEKNLTRPTAINVDHSAQNYLRVLVSLYSDKSISAAKSTIAAVAAVVFVVI